MISIFKNLFDSNEKQLKKIQPTIDEINSFEEKMSELSDEKLKQKTEEFRKKIDADLEKSREEFSTPNETLLKEKL